MSSRPIGILGGTFDPIHHGHLRLALEVRETLDLDHVRFVPAGLTNLRAPPAASGAQRLAMVQAAIAAPALVIDTRELDRSGVSYTVETLESMRAEFGPRPLCFILGQDAFNALPRWQRWQDLLQLAHLVVATRPGSTLLPAAQLAELVRSTRISDPGRLAAAPAGCLYLQQIPLLPISSTDIRARCKAGRSIAYLTPPGVEAIIEREHLYQS